MKIATTIDAEYTVFPKIWPNCRTQTTWYRRPLIPEPKKRTHTTSSIDITRDEA
jgi:hypothetical protein